MKKLTLSLLIISLSLLSTVAQQTIVKPSKAHLRWHGYEQTMFVCLDPCTWQGREYDNHSMPLNRVNPRQLDTDQWCETAKLWGAKMILFVAKHTGGFCWWQTETSNYSIANTPWRDGKGDVLADLSKSCKKYGLDLGIYVYSGDEQWGAGIGSGGKTTDPAKQEAYNKVYRQQLTEVLTRYGKITEVWFDGGCVVPVDDILTKYASDAVIFGGVSPHNIIKWVGSEDGYCYYPNFYVQNGVWCPAEVDVPLLKNGGHKWFWAENTDKLLMTTEQFIDRYYKSVGRGAVLLLNSTPDTTGLIPASHVARYKSFGEELGRRFGSPIAKTSGTTIKFSRPTTVNHTVVQEDLSHGQLIEAYTIEGLTPKYGWITLVNGLSVGHKRIDRFEDVELTAIRIVPQKQLARPHIKNFEAHNVVETLSWGGNGETAGLPTTVGYWQYDTFDPTQWTEIKLDLTKHMTQIGTYEIEFRETSRLDDGKDCGLDFDQWSVEMYGSTKSDLIKRIEGSNKFRIVRSQQTLDEFNTTFSIKVKRHEGRSSGDINIIRHSYTD